MTKGEQLLLTALSTFGEREIPGPDRNSFIGGIIDRWFRIGASDTEVAWCAIWMSEIASRCGISPPPYPFRAKSWEKIGHEAFHPSPGDVVVLKRGRGLSHVTLLVRVVGDTLWCIGGNQGNAVSIQAYRAADVQAFRRLS